MGKIKKYLCLILLSVFCTITVTPAMGATVEILQTTNISSKVTAIGGLPKSVIISGVSGDGSVVVGKVRNKQPPQDYQFFRYTRYSGIESFGTFGKKSINAIRLSADGLVIAGTFYIENEGSHIFRYTQSNGFQDLGTMGQKAISVNAVSADGSVIVGSFLYSYTPENRPLYHAFRYSQSQGFEALGNMVAESAFAHGLSADGSLIVGNFHAAKRSGSGSLDWGSDHAFSYSRPAGVQDIGAVGGPAAFATGISNDGSVIVGFFFGRFSFSEYRYHNHIFIYTKTGGVEKLGAMGGTSAEAYSISADGTKFSGSYVDSNFFTSRESYAYTAKIVLPVNQNKK